ncbi:hypothetical protein SPAR89_0055 [Streptococcus pneumoniae GA47210]|nr:hypothetical protein SPAR89_0055 [Streptococcus pneumoniae GA47210]EJH01001.1 hypothetical protein SPAR157_0073 [Streptococcus pneumoniae GA54354]
MVLFSRCNYNYYNYYIISIKKVKPDNSKITPFQDNIK